jgi:prepilin-type N-terminal cleavage/methylation domain-containing protein
MFKRFNQAFSLLELMAVLLIISILAYLAYPAYKSYLTKSRFSDVLAAISLYKDNMSTAYQDFDQFPDSFSSLNVGNYSTSSSSSSIQLIYYGRSTDKRSAYLQFFTSDLGVTGYSAASGTGGGTNARVTLAAIYMSTGEMNFLCGQWDGSSTDVPLDYLPVGCQDTNISALIS